MMFALLDGSPIEIADVAMAAEIRRREIADAYDALASSNYSAVERTQLLAALSYTADEISGMDPGRAGFVNALRTAAAAERERGIDLGLAYQSRLAAIAGIVGSADSDADKLAALAAVNV